MDLAPKQKIKSVALEAVVIRADGRREDLGLISYYHRNPVIRAWKRLKMKRAKRFFAEREGQ